MIQEGVPTSPRQMLVTALLVVLTVLSHVRVSAEVHGGTILALKGKKSVVMACDSRFASHRTGGMMITESNRMIYSLGSQCLLGCIGLDCDARDLVNALREKVSSHSDLELGPQSLARCLSNILYKKGLYCTPTVIGLDSAEVPYICSMDGLGSQTISEGFAVSGTASGSLYAICEALYESDQEGEALVIMAKKCMSLAMQRDVMSGGTCSLYVLTRSGVEKRSFDTDDSW